VTSLHLHSDGTIISYTAKNVQIIQSVLFDIIGQDVLSIVTSFFGHQKRDMLTFLGQEDEIALESMPAMWSGTDEHLSRFLPTLSSSEMLGDIVLDSALTLYRNELRCHGWQRTVPRISILGPWMDRRFFGKSRSSMKPKDWYLYDLEETGEKFRKFKNTRNKGIWRHNRIIYPGFVDKHWFLGIIDFDAREFRYYDSLNTSKKSWMVERMQVQIFYSLPAQHACYFCRTTVHHSNSFCAHIQKLNI
jgi:hypothetical protein